MVPVSPVGWTEALCRWSPWCLELGDIGGGCGLLEGLGHFHRRVNNELTDEGGNTKVRPLSVEAEEFSLRTGPKYRVTSGAGSEVVGTTFRPEQDLEK